MKALELIGAKLLERIGTSSKGYVSTYTHPRHGRVIMRHSEGSQAIYLEHNVPKSVLVLADQLRAIELAIWQRRQRNYSKNGETA